MAFVVGEIPSADFTAAVIARTWMVLAMTAVRALINRCMYHGLTFFRVSILPLSYFIIQMYTQKYEFILPK